MDLLDRLLGHDAWTTGEVLRRCAGLSDEQLDRRFDIDHGSVRALLRHVVGNVEVWTDLMLVRPPQSGPREAAPSIESLTRRYEAAYTEFAASARRLQAYGRLNETYLDILDSPPKPKTYGGTIAHVIAHDMHHRAHVLLALGWLGLTDLPEGDVLGWEADLP